MAKEKVYSLEYFAKKGIQGWDPTNEFVDIVSTYATNGNRHPQIAYEGPAPYFAAALYAEHYKRGGGTGSGFFPTNMRIADQMVDWLGAGEGMTILDPGAGFGALGWAVQQRGAKPIMLEWAQWINRIGNAAWGVKLTPDLSFDGDLPIALADFVNGYAPPPFDAVIANPPFGKVFGHAAIEIDFMNKIADCSPRGTPVCVLLPNHYLDKERPKAAVEMRARYEVCHEEDQAPGEFKPLTNIATTMYLLETVADGHGIYKER
jgi:predicted RNA methylase